MASSVDVTLVALPRHSAQAQRLRRDLLGKSNTAFT
jgi:hypothetical protein